MRTPVILSLLLAPALALVACKGDPAAEARPAVKRPSEPRALLYHVEDHVVAAAKTGDEAKVRAALKAYLATAEDFAAVFGARGPTLYAAYTERIVPKFLAEAPAFVIARVKEGYTEVMVRPVGPALPEFTVPGDQITLDAMAKKQPMMSVWIRPPGNPLGLRLEGWLYREGRWLTVLKLHQEITRLADEAAEAKAKAAEAAAKAAAPDAAPASEGSSPP